MKGSICADHQFEIKLLTTLFRNRSTDKPPAISSHKIDDFGCYQLCGTNEIPFVFTILIVHHDHYLALAYIFNGLRDGVQFDKGVVFDLAHSMLIEKLTGMTNFWQK